jgi:hypothetical protein
MARQICQSCGMPLKDNNRGTEINGDTSEKYCVHCYKKGEFTWKGANVKQMQTYCMGVLTNEKHWPAFLAHWATKKIPKLERWSRV